ncbi:hypothetical protein GALL_549040 [mine drainage metagenome]|uniref:Uncharacterized protein n=1 Tax=mine drainage metagenome TaxID=410659 RepID=A0A1J5PE91_9ZZZZ
MARVAAAPASAWAVRLLGGNQPPPDSTMARLKSPLAEGVASRASVLIPPALSPATVTLAGSPPKAAMLRFTHWSAAIWSIRP